MMSDESVGSSQISAASVEDLAALRSVLKKFCAESIRPRVRELEHAEQFPRELYEALGELGAFGCIFSEDLGGSNMGFEALALVAEELAYAYPPVSAAMNLQAATVPLTIKNWGRPDQVSKYVSGLINGTVLGSNAMTEPDGGTDVLGLKTRAALEGDEWSVRGQKLFTTLADDADAILVLCRTDPIENNKRARGLSLVLTPRQQKGVEVQRLELMGMRAGCTCEVFLDDARAPKNALIGPRGRGWYTLLSSLDEERILSAAIYVGITEAALDIAVQYAQDRTAFDRPIGTYQAVQHPLAEVATELEQIRLITQKAAWLLSQGRECSREAAMAKLAATETAIRATDRCMRVLGGFGLVEESPLERLFRDARLGPFSPISNEMVKNFLGERMGLPRSY